MEHVDKALDLANAIVDAWRARCIVPIHREVKPIKDGQLQGELQKGSGG